ncbi:OmpH family outer membrane protein [Pseudodesulfovibrio sp. F-1]|uniref:OmpH family outer membrane protein n=1 Tax=Pseudodesulfovibrio alkaliphilus TaxID=2661613 RepID=A0A7K1KLN9_9BACT|nr:OmpH family outer membrane protein [Pseudodesulfovibrio alkaliphilus]MUM76871.1 OmpH family outer membrane protein [Pseudodesulfovibrio alkaliphilus]
MKMLKVSLFILCLFLALPVSAQVSKVGFVNPQRIINESRIGRIAQEDLARLGREKDRRVRESLERVEAIKAEIGQGTLTVSEEQTRERALRLAAREYEILVEESNADIQTEERQLIQFVMRRADSILRRIAEEAGFTMILTDPEIIGYVANSMDITDRVIKELDAMI